MILFITFKKNIPVTCKSHAEHIELGPSFVLLFGLGPNCFERRHSGQNKRRSKKEANVLAQATPLSMYSPRVCLVYLMFMNGTHEIHIICLRYSRKT